MKIKFQFGKLRRIIQLKDKPEHIAGGFALGSFIGMLPVPGFQLLVSLLAASLLRLNRKAACLGVFNTNVATGAFVFMFNFWLGKKLLGMHPVFEMPEKIDITFVSLLFSAGREVFLSMFVGGILSGTIVAFASYFILMKILVVAKPHEIKKIGNEKS